MHTVIVTFLSFFTVFSHRTPSIFPPEKKKKQHCFKLIIFSARERKLKLQSVMEMKNSFSYKRSITFAFQSSK